MLSRCSKGRLLTLLSTVGGAVLVSLGATTAPATQPVTTTPATTQQAATRPSTRPTTRATTRPAPFPDLDAGALPTSPGDHKLRFHAVTGKHPLDLAVLLHLPARYRPDGPKWPMIVFLHGGGETGTDLGAIYGNGPMTMLRRGANDRFAASCPFIVLCPQCPPRGQRWDQPVMIDSVVKLLDDVSPRVNADPDRVYLTGLSMGGIGTWRTAFQAGDRFAAIAPMSAVSYKPDLMPLRLKYTAVWSVVGLDDAPVFVGGTRQMNNALADNPEEIRFTTLLGNGHDAWWPTYAAPVFYEWLLAHHRPSAAERAAIDAAATTQPALSPRPVPSTQPVATTRPSSPFPQQPGHSRLWTDINVGLQAFQMDYLLYLPTTYRPGGPPVPVILSFNEQGVIGADLAGLCPHGPDFELAKPGSTLSDRFPFAVIAPRTPIKCDWTSPGIDDAVMSLLDHALAGLNLDRSRVSVTGIDAGSSAAIRIATEHPDRFAAVVPVQCFDHFDAAALANAQSINAVPGRFYQNPAHRRSIRALTDQLAALHLPWQITPLAAPPAAPTDPVDTSMYADPTLLDWLAAQHAPALARQTASN